MLRTLLKSIIYILLFVFTLLFFLPKENIYYYLEEKLANYNTIISNEKLSEGAFSLDIKGAKLYSNDIFLADIDSLRIYTNLFYTKVKINEITIDKSFQAFIPLGFSHIYFTHSIIDPLNGYISAKSDIGNISGVYKIGENKISFILNPNNNLQTNYKDMLRRFKTSDGKYKYEFRY